MVSSWIPSKLSDVVEIHTGKISVDEAELADYISTDNLLPDFGGVNPAEKMPATGKVTTYKVGDILFSNIRTYFKKLWLADKSGSCSNDVIVFSPKNGIESEYIYHLLMNDEFIEYTVKTSKGTKMPRGDKDAIMKYEFLLAPQHERKFIGDSLVCYKKKIELNRQTNQTLEQMAQALFKSWFVDFDPVIDNALAAGKDIPEALQHKAEQRAIYKDKAQQLQDFKPLPDDIRALFPSEFEQTDEPTIGIAGWIPKGWNIKPADEIADISIGKTPPRKQNEWFSEERYGNVVWVSIRDMGAESTFIGDSSEYLTPESISKFNIKVVPKGSVILSFKMTLGRVCIASCDLATNEAIAHFVNPKFGLTKEYIYSYLKAFDYDLLGSTSSIATAVNSKIIKKMPFLVPSVDIVQSFNDSLGRIFSKKLLILEQSRALENLRDTLLPKLISGEIILNQDVV